jgi:hypothetical protein
LCLTAEEGSLFTTLKSTYSLYSTGLLPGNRFMPFLSHSWVEDGEISFYTGLLEPSGDTGSVPPTSETDRYWHWYSGKFDLIETSAINTEIFSALLF